MDYFSRSQDVRRSIEASPELMGGITEHLITRIKAPLIGRGGQNNHYRIGRISDNLWVATRESILRGSLEYETEILEEYCQNAERYSKSGKYIVTSFCVGLSYPRDGERTGIILIEDLTKGGSVTIKPISDGDEGIIEGKRRRVMFDLNFNLTLFDYKPELRDGIRYFNLQNMIVLP